MRAVVSFTEEAPCVLLVDDYPANLLALEAVLEPLGADLLVANSGSRALQLVQDRARSLACILLDVQMPVLSGIDTARALKASPRTQDTPILFLTGYSPSPEELV